MFGDFYQNFGLNFPLQGADPQGGLLGANSPPGPPQSGVGSPEAAGGAPLAPTAPAAPAASLSPAAGVGGASPSPTAAGSPLSSPLGMGQATTAPTNPAEPSPMAPAAGVGSQFGGKV